jgi:hypothetical protein
MILTGENQSTWIKTCPIATVSTTNPTWPALGLNPGLYGDRVENNCMVQSNLKIYTPIVDDKC